MSNPALVKVAEFSAQTGLSRRAVLEMCRTKQIRALKLSAARNSPWRIPRAELDRFLKEVA